MRPARWVDRYQTEKSRLGMDESTSKGIIVGLIIFIVLLAISNYLWTGSVIA